MPKAGKAQYPSWSRINDFCPDTTLASSTNIAHYADDSVFIAAGHTQTAGVSALHSYIACYNYQGQLLNSRSLYFAGTTNAVANYYPIVKTGKDRYLLTGLELDTVTKKKLRMLHPYFYFFTKEGDSIRYIRLGDTVISRHPYAVVQDKEKNIIACGYISGSKISYNSWSSEYYYDSLYMWLAKYDTLGNQLWSRKYMPAGTYNGFAYKVCLDKDSLSLIVGGAYGIVNTHLGENVVLKVSTSGQLLWQKKIPKPYQTDYEMDIVPLSDGGFAFITSYSDSLPIAVGTPSPPYIYYGKLNDKGDILWSKYFRRAFGESYGMKIEEVDSNDLLLLANVFIYPKYRPTVIRTNSKGDIKWYREYFHLDTTYMWTSAYTASFTKMGQILVSGDFGCKQVIPGVFDTVGSYSWFALTDTFGCLVPGCQKEDTMWHTAVKDINEEVFELSIYPNPVQQTLYVKVGSHNAKGLQLYLTDINGRRLVSKAAQEQTTSIDMQTLPAGIYMLEVWNKIGKLKVYKVEHY